MKALKILVTGANGFLGRSLLGLEGEAEWMGCGRRVDAGDMLYHRVELTDRAAVAALVAETNPDWVINTASMTKAERVALRKQVIDAAVRAGMRRSLFRDASRATGHG